MNKHFTKPSDFSLITFLSLFLFVSTLSAQDIESSEEENNAPTRLLQKLQPIGMDSYSYMVLYYNGCSIYANRGHLLATGDTIVDIKINPSGTSVASLQKTRKGKVYCRLYDIQENRPNYILKTWKPKEKNITALAYSADARQLAIASDDANIEIYNAVTNILEQTITSSLVPSKMVYSNNRYFLAVYNNNKIEIWNMLELTVRQTISHAAAIKDVKFSEDSQEMYVLTENGNMTIYNTSTFKSQKVIDNLGMGEQLYPERKGKYVAVVTDEDKICVVNLLSPTRRAFLSDSIGGINNIRFTYNEFDNMPCLIYNTSNSIVYHPLTDLKPNYTKMMAAELNEKLGQWMKQMPDETLEEYKARVNETTRAEKASELEREIATRMASEDLDQLDFSIGDYNTSTKKLAIGINAMQNIYLDVDLDEVNSFSNNGKLEFRNMKYGLTSEDDFELVYAEVYNPANGKTYTFNNMKRESLAYIEENANFIPLEIVQKTNMEETKLEGIKEEVIAQAQQKQVISDKTHISVNTKAVPTVNANGERTINYDVDFTYAVEEEFSARDDFKPGKYHIEESGAAMSMFSIMQKAFENDFAQYIKDGKRIKISIKGSADALPIMKTLPYDGKYGEYRNEPIYKGQELSNISLTRQEGISNNDQLAFARAIGVQYYIDKKLSVFDKMNRSYEYQIEVSNEKGSKYRRISVRFTFYEAF